MSTIYHGAYTSLCGILTLLKNPIISPCSHSDLHRYKLARISLIREFFHKGWDQFVPFIVTIFAILFTDLLVGIVIGIVVGLFYLVRSNFRSSILVVNDQNRYLVRLRKDVSFLNKPIIKNKLEEIPDHSIVLIDATRADFIDKDIIDVVNEFSQHAHLKNISVDVKRSPHNPMHMLFITPKEEELEPA
jgi:MFS superfamily sulfate permease-like transporter